METTRYVYVSHVVYVPYQRSGDTHTHVRASEHTDFRKCHIHTYIDLVVYY